MKTFVCTRIKVIADRYVTSIAGNVVSFTSGRAWETLTFVNASIAEALSQSMAGDLVTQTLKVEGEITSDLANRMKLPSIFELTLSDGRTVIWGDKKIRCKAKASTLNAGYGTASFERKTTAFQF